MWPSCLHLTLRRYCRFFRLKKPRDMHVGGHGPEVQKELCTGTEFMLLGLWPLSSQTKLAQSVASSQPHTCRNSNQPHLLLKLVFCPLTEAEVSKLLLSSHTATCPLDPIPSHLLQAIYPSLLPALTHIINTSLLTGTFPNAFKQARVTPLL